MKAFIALALVVCIACANAYTEEQLKRANEVMEKCADKEGITKDAAEKLKHHDFSDVDEKVKCFAKCFMEELGMFKDGALVEDVTVKKLTADGVNTESIKKAVEECKNEKGANDCDTALKIFQCYVTKKVALA